ncbi:hypothetical protein MMPV_000762 [Pyropia vietnamensis]
MTISGIAAVGVATAVAVAAAAAAAAASPAAAVGVLSGPALHVTFRQASAIPPELLVGKQPPGFFPPGSEPTPIPQQGPSPTATVAPSMAPTASPSVAPTGSPSMAPTPTSSVAPSATPSPGATAAPSMTATAAPSMAPTAAPTAAPSAMPGGALTPTKERVRVYRRRGKAMARTRNAECLLTTYKGYRPRVTTRRPVVHTDAAGKQMAVVGLRRRLSCTIPAGKPSMGTPTGVIHGGKVYASLGARGEGGWCEAGVALAKDALSSSFRPRSRGRDGRDIRMYVYTEGEAMCELVKGSRKPREEDD